MSYQGGMGSGNGYRHGYDPPGNYRQSGFTQPFPPPGPHTNSWDTSSQSMTMQQQMQMQQIQHAQSHNQAAFNQQQQYAPMPSTTGSTSYYQTPIGASPQYPQYSQQYEQQYVPQPHFRSPMEQQYQIPQRYQQQVPQTQIPSLDGAGSPIYPGQQIPGPQQASIKITNSPDPIIQKSQKQTPPSSQSPDSAMLLVFLAEEYFEAAHCMGPSLARHMQENLVEEYQKAIATGLGCMEAALTQTQTRLPPRMEARLRLRYSGVLLEETDNHMEAETCLSQGIALSEQNRYLDLKYCMQAMLAQMVYKKSPKAALKSLERHCKDAASYRHFCWEYIFHLLKASMSMASNRISDLQSTLHDLHHVAALAQEREDHGVYLLSSLMEILAHLATPSPESKEQIQRSLATAWSYQTKTNSHIPQLEVLTHILDLTCSLVYDIAPQAVARQKALETTFKNSGWSTSCDTVSIPIQKTRAQGQIVSQDTRGLIGSSEDGRDTLILSFMNNNDAFALVYLLSGIALLHENSVDGRAVKYLREGLKTISGGKVSRRTVSALPEAMAKSQWRAELVSYFHVYMVFCYAITTDWNSAKDQLNLLEESLRVLKHPEDSALALLHTYLSGICCHGLCDLDGALRMYKNPSLHLAKQSAPSATGLDEQLREDLAILASLNVLWILQEGIQFDPSQNTVMISELEPLCDSHRNRDIQTAFNLVRATVITKPPTATIKTKNYLSKALEGAKSASNKQFIAISLSVMCGKFFVGVVGNQAEKAGRAAVNQARKAKDTLWSSVSNGMLAETLETQGKLDEARVVQVEAHRLAAMAFPNS